MAQPSLLGQPTELLLVQLSDPEITLKDFDNFCNSNSKLREMCRTDPRFIALRANKIPVAEMNVYLPRSMAGALPLPLDEKGDEGELFFYSKDLRTNKRKEIMLNFENVIDSVRILKDRIQRGEKDEEFALESEMPLYVNTYYEDHVTVISDRLSCEVDKALFLRLLEEYVAMFENRESGKVTITFGGEVVKEIIS